jgi:hypothetical protein
VYSCGEWGYVTLAASVASAGISIGAWINHKLSQSTVF